MLRGIFIYLLNKFLLLYTFRPRSCIELQSNVLLDWKLLSTCLVFDSLPEIHLYSHITLHHTILFSILFLYIVICSILLNLPVYIWILNSIVFIYMFDCATRKNLISICIKNIEFKLISRINSHEKKRNNLILRFFD